MSLRTSDEIRESFLKYFESKGHLRAASSSLIPVGDPTLLLTNAGMVQFKPYFAGETDPPSKRLTSSQKSFRVVDIEEVGDATHITMFEMLGNFSIGDYFKEGAVAYALECFESVMGLPKERFAATVHHTDDEAHEIWVRAGIPAERIYGFGDADNWWGPPIHGSEGPCGPCSELHYDFGDGRPGCGLDDCGPNCENLNPETGMVCQRYVELWNLVFMQYYHHPDGSRDRLPATGIDTGMGFERLVTVLQGVDTVYETDLFRPLVERVEELSGARYRSDPETTYAISVVAEHGRSAAFLLADGVVPGNEGRGYVLRRIIRRAIRHGRRLGLEDPFLGEIAVVVTDRMGAVYPELRNNREFVLTSLRLEEEKFQQAYENGYAALSEALKSGDLGGGTVFRLWDTYGFPVEMTQEIADEAGVDVDMEGFEREMAAQRERARASAQFGADRVKIRLYESLGIGGTRFLGYQQVRADSVVVGMVSGDGVVSEATEGDEVELAIMETPFYPEGGGQVGDAGEIVAPDGRIAVTDTQTVMPGLIMHFGRVVEGNVSLGDSVDAVVDPIRREDTARNHTATHMLHAALRQVLGSHVRQAGSLVAPDRLRFDFSHVTAMTPGEIDDVQLLVNEKIRENVGVRKSEDRYARAIERGALAFFGDKYEDTVRLVEIANGDTFSFEVCGGTHVHHTGELGAVYVLGESSIGTGMRRIEAVSGRGAERVVRDRFRAQNAVASRLSTTPMETDERVGSLLEEMESLRRENEALERRLALQAAEAMLDAAEVVDGVTVLAHRVNAAGADAMREMGDWLRSKMGSGIVALGTVVNDRPQMVVMVTPDLVERGFDAVAIARGAAKAIGGGGGGRPDVAQAGGRRADGLDAALRSVADLVRGGSG